MFPANVGASRLVPVARSRPFFVPDSSEEPRNVPDGRRLDPPSGGNAGIRSLRGRLTLRFLAFTSLTSEIRTAFPLRSVETPNPPQEAGVYIDASPC